jgi:Fic-DOC domain mobile mystery protein B
VSDNLFEPDDGQTPIDEGERQDLIPSIFTKRELNLLERENVNSARNWALAPRMLKKRIFLDDLFVRELHRRMFLKVWRWAGVYRKTPRTLGVDAYRIPEGVRNTIDDARCWMENRTYPIREIAIRLHYQLVFIHPWANGNGRHARLMADCLIAAADEAPLSWGGKPESLLGAGNLRRTYIQAMQVADAQQDFGPLFKFCR